MGFFVYNWNDLCYNIGAKELHVSNDGGICVDQQRQEIRAEDWLPLAKHVVKKFVRLRFGQRIDETEEYSDALLGLTNAISSWNPAIADFKTHAYTCIRNAIIHNGRRRKRQRRLPTESLDRMSRRDIQEIPDHRGQNGAMPTWVLKKFFEDHPDDTDKDRRCKKIMHSYYVDDMTLDQLADEHHVTKERVRQLKLYALDLLKKRYGDMIQEELSTKQHLPE